MDTLNNNEYEQMRNSIQKKEGEFAVVKNITHQNHDYGNTMSFSKFHTSLDEAKIEAERLCKKEKCSFIVLKAICEVNISEVPVIWKEL